MITRQAIKHLMEIGLITVKPEPVRIGPNSIDLRLGDSLKQYASRGMVHTLDPSLDGVRCAGDTSARAIDPKNPPELVDVPKLEIHHVPGHPEHIGGWLLMPGEFYLGVTMEETFCRGVVPHLDGRSTCGRLSIEAHKTAGVGDNGFRGHWTLEMEVTKPVIVMPGDRLFQLYFTPAWGDGVAVALRAMLEGKPAVLGADGQVSCGDYKGPLLELHDLYGNGEGHHYQGSMEVKGPSPLD